MSWYTNLSLTLIFMITFFKKCAEDLFIKSIKILPENFWKFMWYTYNYNKININIKSESNEYKLKWILYFSIYSMNNGYWITTRFLKQIINTNIISIILIIDKKYYNVIIDLENNKFTKSENIWQYILFNRIQL